MIKTPPYFNVPNHRNTNVYITVTVQLFMGKMSGGKAERTKKLYFVVLSDFS